MTKKITCLRRMTEFGGWERKEGLDRYERGGGLVGQSRSCSFCGSLPPDDFMDLVRAGEMLGPTDKTYKVYVGEPNHSKFYFQHLSEDQRREFFELYRTDRLAVGYPGHFYVLPFFITHAPKGGTP